MYCAEQPYCHIKVYSSRLSKPKILMYKRHLLYMCYIFTIKQQQLRKQSIQLLYERKFDHTLNFELIDQLFLLEPIKVLILSRKRD